MLEVQDRPPPAAGVGVMLRPPDGGTGLELASFVRPNHQPGWPDAMASELGLRSVVFDVDDLQAIIDLLAVDGYQFARVGQHEDSWRMASVRGPEGIIVSLCCGYAAAACPFEPY